MFLCLRLQPDRVAMREKVVVGLFFGDDAATHGNDGALAGAKDALEGALLNRAITGLTVERKNLGERHTGIFFNFLVELDERHVAFRSQPGAERGFSGASETDERDASEALILFGAEVAHQASGGFFQAMGGKAFDETQDNLLLRGELIAVSLVFFLCRRE